MSDALYPEPGGEDYTDGWSGSDASHDRAIDDQKSGRAVQRREQAVRRLGEVGAHGLTWQELGADLGLHHGQSSSVLSILHKEQRIARLQDRRNRCHIYVLPEHVEGRETREAGRTAANRDHPAVDAIDMQDRLTAAADDGYDRGYAAGSKALDERTAEAYHEGHDKGHAVGHSEGWKAGHNEGWNTGTDAGWQTGYDTAMQEQANRPSPRELVDAAYANGKAEGRNEEALRLLRLVSTMRDTLVKTYGHRSHVHSSVCWMENPGCALLSVEKGINRSLPTPPRPRQPQ